MTTDLPALRGSKGGKGSGAGRSPVESPDSLRSKAYARVVDLVSEGEIQGLVNGLKSVLLDGVPLENQDGSRNFTDCKIDWRYGTQGQGAMDSFSAQESEINVSQQVTSAVSVARTITNVNVDAVRVTLSIPQLAATDVANGDVTGTSVEFAIDVQSAGGGFVEKFRQTISGKTVDGYQRSVRVALTGAAPWDVRVRRITADSASQYLVNALYWASYTEIISTRLRYPNSAVVGISIDAQQFSRIPVRGYDMLGVRVRVPVNYDPIARSYAGVWDGTFKIAWTNNPAWCFYELLTNRRWGLGRFIDEQLVNKWALYTIGQYCDAPVPDGRGGTEPRFALNVYLQTQAEAYDLVQALASCFRAMIFWGPAGIEVAQDAPADAVALYTNANVVDGAFAYEESSARARHTVAIVQWNDPVDQYRAKQVYVQDDDGIKRYGVVQTQIVAFGCTSRGQAVRAGKWVLLSELNETEAVTFRVGFEGVLAMPGQVISIADARRAGDRTGGRIRSATSTTVTLDAPVTLNGGESYSLMVINADAAAPVITRAVTNGAGVTQTLMVSPALPQAPAAESVWILASDAVVPTTWRVLAVAEVEGSNEFQITAIAHNPSKYSAVELGLKLENYPVSRPAAFAAPPSNLQLREIVYVDKDGTVRPRLSVSWTPGAPALKHRVTWRRATTQWRTEPDTAQNSLDLVDVSIGLYEVQVRSVTALGQTSAAVSASTFLDGKTDAPGGVSTFQVTATPDGTRQYHWLVPSPTPPDLSGFEVRYLVAPTAQWEAMSPLFSVAAVAGQNLYRHDSVEPVPAATYTFALAAIDSSGNASDPYYVSGVALPVSGAPTSPGVVVDAPTDLFKVDANGAATTPSITITATLTGGLSGAVTWSAGAGFVGTPPVGTNAWTILATEQTADAVTYTATKIAGSNTYTDTITLVRLRDGSNALTAIITNEAHTVPATAAGVVTSFAGAGGAMRVYRGTTLLTTGVTYSVAANASGLTASLDAAGNYSVTAAGAWPNGSSVATLTLRATIDATGTQLDKVFTVTKSLQGAQGTQGIVGPQGGPGPTGQRGSVWEARAIAGSTWSNSEAALAISSAGYGAPVNLDRVTLHNASLQYSETRFYANGSWLFAGVMFSGNMFIDGTLAAQKLVARTITTDRIQIGAATAAGGLNMDTTGSPVNFAGGAGVANGTFFVASVVIANPQPVTFASAVLGYAIINLTGAGIVDAISVKVRLRCTASAGLDGAYQPIGALWLKVPAWASSMVIPLIAQRIYTTGATAAGTMTFICEVEVDSYSAAPAAVAAMRSYEVRATHFCSLNKV